MCDVRPAVLVLRESSTGEGFQMNTCFDLETNGRPFFVPGPDFPSLLYSIAAKDFPAGKQDELR